MSLPLRLRAKAFQAVAKIYDPLYYNFEWDFSHQPQDTVWRADSDYSREAAAYEHLQETETLSSFAPAYHGAWTFSLPIVIREASSSRAIRMILIERLDGISIQNMRARNNPDPNETDDAFHYPEDYRLEVLATAMDHYVRMLHSGLEQGDFASRNIVLVNSTEPSAGAPVISGLPLPHVVLVDYNTSVVHIEPSLQRQASTGQFPASRQPNAAVVWYAYERLHRLGPSRVAQDPKAEAGMA